VFDPGNEDIMRKSEDALGLSVIIGGFLVILFILVGVVACDKSGGGDSYYYPQTTHYGYYDTHHRYHYFPKYDRHSKVYVAPRKGAPGVKVKPAPRSGGGFSFRKSGGSGFKSSGGSRRR